MLRVGLAKLAAQKIAIAKVVGLVGGGVGGLSIFPFLSLNLRISLVKLFL